MPADTGSDVLIVGGGLAGSFTAHAFAVRGARVSLLESGDRLACKASGNRFGLLTPYIATNPSPLEALYSKGFTFSSAFISRSDDLAPLIQRCGALQLPGTSRLKNALSGDQQLLGAPDIKRLSAQEATSLSGIKIASSAFYVSEAGFIEPTQVVHRLVQKHPALIHIHHNTHVAQIRRSGALWQILSSQGRTFTSPIVVLCNAYEAAALEVSSWLPLEAIRGQTVSVLSTPLSSRLRTVVTFGGYLTPAVDGLHFLGAHYRHNDPNPDPSSTDTSDILNRCEQWLPDMQRTLAATRDARVCFRTSTIDRLPYVGALPNFSGMKQVSLGYRSGTDLTARVPLTHYDGLYVHLGHGSRGLLSCPVGAEIIARLATKQELLDLSTISTIITPDRLPYRLLPRGV
jgi:tRNA 5-methylaminomethyl-2-thiouridine biosynthesis bifunctional protein